ncbi:sphingomyelin synthase [Mortierella polycephala]|uniref:Sphingomyelin synthase n=1 Tax=Mortierella polycephala TaxID=41804 RepID=A0A9P6PTT6_9FUNG|nr:sphingomyelin synthase [Mortierella polycephala]
MRLWMERVKRWFHQRYKFTRWSVFWTLFCIVVFGLTLYFMNVMANVASYLAPDNNETPKLNDRLFDVIPSIKLLWLTDLADVLLFAPTVILVLTHYRPLYLLCKVLLTWALCNLMRITTVAITSFPDPRDGCMHSLGEFFSTFTLHRCGDCMFSGHTIIFVISALVWTSHGYHRFPRRLRWLAWIVMIFVWCLCIGSAFIVIANRAHYTVDILVAFYVAGGNWYIWTYIFDHYIEEKGRLTDLTRPWGDGPDPRPHAQERARKRQRASMDLEKNAMATQENEVAQIEPLVIEARGVGSYSNSTGNNLSAPGSNVPPSSTTMSQPDVTAVQVDDIQIAPVQQRLEEGREEPTPGEQLNNLSSR